MRPSFFLLAVLVITMLTTGCRDTRDASDAEITSLQMVTESLWSAQDADSDQGESSVGALSANYSVLLQLSKAPAEDVEETDGDGMAIGLRPSNLGLVGGHFIDESRQPWPDCITEIDGGVSYGECEYAFGDEDGSIAFLLDGSYTWSDQAAAADLTFDFSVGSSDLSWEWMSYWGMDFTWTDTTADGTFDVDYSYGVSLGGLPPLGGAVFSLSGSVNGLTTDDSCDQGPVAGIIDWTAILRENLDRPEQLHVTIEWEGCGQATITQ